VHEVQKFEAFEQVVQVVAHCIQVRVVVSP